jgi:hypothetical protein
MANQLHRENHSLLQLLVKNKKCITPEFIISFIGGFETETIERTNTSLKTIIEILKNFNMELMADHTLLIERILNYVHRKPKQLNLKNMLLNDAKIEGHVISQLSVLCILMKEDVIKFVESEKTTHPYLTDLFAKKKHDESYNRAMEDIEMLLKLRSLDTFVLNSVPLKKVAAADKELPNDLSCMIDENMFEYLRRVMEIDKVIERSRSSDAGYHIELILTNLCLYLQILNEMIRYKCLNEEKFRNSILTKKVQYYLQELEVKIWTR